MAKITGLKVIEVEKYAVPDLDPASAAAVATLGKHPGFQYLLAKLRFQRAALREALVKTKHKEIRDVEFLQSGANWCGWLEEQLAAAVGLVNKPASRPTREFEREAFERLLSQIDVVGVAKEPTTAP